MQCEPADPIAAVTHPDPYPYYARLSAAQPLYRDTRLQLWVASGARVVAQVLASELCHVRATTEPVPRVLGNTAAAAIFGRLVRMTDGSEQRGCKQAITAVLASLGRETIVGAARRSALDTGEELRAHPNPAALVASADAGTDEVIVANGIGLMSQSYEATAGLIGNTLLALAREPRLYAAVRRTPALLATLIQRVLHLDPPTQSTRRFVVRDANVAGQRMQAGDTILVILAAAGRDSGLLPPPGELALEDWSRAPGNFGAGRHACPAGSMAALIAEAAVAHLLELGLELRELTASHRYRTSNHVRVPMFV
jgi:cytochrome P450